MRLFRPALFAIGLLLTPVAIAQDAPAPVVPDAPVAATAAAPAPAPAVAAPQPARPVERVGQPKDGLIGIQQQVTPTGRQALFMHDVILMPVIVAISLFVLALLFWASFRYRRAANPVPSKTSHNTLIEVIWTLVPVLILVGIAVPSIGLLAAQYKPVGKDAVTIKAIGNQWYWSYEYPDHGGFEVTANMLKDADAKANGEPRLLAVDNRIVVPVGVPVRLLTTSNDVLHAWAVPAFWVKMDAVPGRINETSFTIEKPGVYYGQCSELCGARHGYMPIAVEAVSQEAFAQWIASKGGTMPGQAVAAAPVSPAPVAATKS
jgi:cytochrome c oxidase subunit II